jgi:hypothetical protein
MPGTVDPDAFNAFEAAGWEERPAVEVRTDAFTHVEASPDSLWDGLMRGTVRMAALVLGQPEATRRRIRAAFDGLVTAYETGGHLALPVSVKLASGRKPAAPGVGAFRDA